jgi:hypothetical protein
MASEAPPPSPPFPLTRSTTPIPTFPLKGKERSEPGSVTIEGRYQSFASQEWRKAEGDERMPDRDPRITRVGGKS